MSLLFPAWQIGFFRLFQLGYFPIETEKIHTSCREDLVKDSVGSDIP